MDIKKILPQNGPPINEVSKYIEKYKNDLIVIKYGGNVFIDRNIFDNFITDITILNKLGISIAVVHGGGPRIKRELDKSNIKSKFLRWLDIRSIFSSDLMRRCGSRNFSPGWDFSVGASSAAPSLSGSTPPRMLARRVFFVSLRAASRSACRSAICDSRAACFT